VRVLLPFPPGGPSDMVMRLAADKMQAVLKQPVVIENRPAPAATWARPRWHAPRATATPGCSAPTRC
jgi:hypothetical protein